MRSSKWAGTLLVTSPASRWAFLLNSVMCLDSNISRLTCTFSVRFWNSELPSTRNLSRGDGRRRKKNSV